MKVEGENKLTISMQSWLNGVIVVALALAFFEVSRFILVLIASIVIASAIEPIAIWAKKRGIPRIASVLSTYILSAIILIAFFYLILVPLIGEVSSFIKTLTIYTNVVNNDSVLSSMFARQNVFGGIDTPAVVTQLGTYLSAWHDFLSQGIFSSFSVIFGGVVSFILMIVLSFYLSVQEDGITKLLRMVTPLKHEPYVISLWKRTQIKIGRWMQGQILLGVIIMVLVYVGLLILGIPHALLLAVVAGVLEIIPLFGPILSAIPGIFAAFTDQGLSMALIVASLYLVIQQFENHVIYPLVVKKVIGIPPIVSIVALVIGGELGGFLGMLVSVPMVAAVMEFLNDLEEKKVAQLSASN